MKILANAHSKPTQVVFSDIGGEVIARGKEAFRWPYVILANKTADGLILRIKQIPKTLYGQLTQHSWSRKEPGRNWIAPEGELYKTVPDSEVLSELEFLDSLGIALFREDRLFPLYMRLSGADPKWLRAGVWAE